MAGEWLYNYKGGIRIVMDMGKGERHGAAVHGRSKAGETLAETLVTMLIVGLSSALFVTMVGAAGRIFQGAKTKYGEIYDKITVAEEQDNSSIIASSSGKITVGRTDDASTGAVSFTAVDWYGDTDYVISYKVK